MVVSFSRAVGSCIVSYLFFPVGCDGIARGGYGRDVCYNPSHRTQRDTFYTHYVANFGALCGVSFRPHSSHHLEQEEP